MYHSISLKTNQLLFHNDEIALQLSLNFRAFWTRNATILSRNFVSFIFHLKKTRIFILKSLTSKCSLVKCLRYWIKTRGSQFKTKYIHKRVAFFFRLLKISVLEQNKSLIFFHFRIHTGSMLTDNISENVLQYEITNFPRISYYISTLLKTIEKITLL